MLYEVCRITGLVSVPGIMVSEGKRLSQSPGIMTFPCLRWNLVRPYLLGLNRLSKFLETLPLAR